MLFQGEAFHFALMMHGLPHHVSMNNKMILNYLGWQAARALRGSQSARTIEKAVVCGWPVLDGHGVRHNASYRGPRWMGHTMVYWKGSSVDMCHRWNFCVFHAPSSMENR